MATTVPTEVPTAPEGGAAVYKTEFARRAILIAIPATLVLAAWDFARGRPVPAALELLFGAVVVGGRMWRPTPLRGRLGRWLLGVGLAAIAIIYGFNDPTQSEHLIWLPMFPLAFGLGMVWREAMIAIVGIAVAHVALYVDWRITHGAWPIRPTTLVEGTVVYALSTFLVGRFDTLIDRHVRALATLAETDPLTGIANRRCFMRHAEYEALRMRRSGAPWSVVWLDLDHFKSINDRFGHEKGDLVLRTVADRVRRQIRDVDIVARVGGEEFAVLMPSTGIAGATIVAERLCMLVAQEQIADCSVTCSLGVAESARGEAIDAVFRRADAALYDAKESGRNRVVAAA